MRMFSRKAVLLVFVTFMVASSLSASNEICCTQKESQNMMRSCKCYCSKKCAARQKELDDRPVWIEDDPYGIHCYCNAEDAENVGRCMKKPRPALDELKQAIVNTVKE